MAKKKAKRVSIFDDIVSHQIYLERAKKGEEKIAFSTVSAIDREIANQFLLLDKNYTKKQLDFVLKSVEKKVEAYYEKTVLRTLEDTARDVSSFEIDFAQDILENYLVESGETLPIVNEKAVIESVLGTRYQGKKLESWTKKLGEQKIKDVRANALSLASENASPSELAASVRRSVLRSNNAATKVSNAYFNQAVNVSRNEVYNKNPEWAEEMLWTSILDSRTTLTCAVRSNQRYDAKTKEPIGHDNSWEEGPGLIHWGCRSIGIPTRKDGKYLVDGEFVSVYSGEKVAIGAEKDYERGGNANEDGKIYKIPRPNNQLEIQTVSGKTNYETWLRTQPRAFIEDTLGVKKAAMFIDGKQSLQNFVVEDGRELTVKELTKNQN